MFTTVMMRLGAVSNSISISAAQLFLAILIILALIKMYKTKDFSVFKKGFFIFFILMVIAETISTFTGVDTANSLKSYSSFWVMLYLPAVYVIFEGRDKMTYLGYVSIGAVSASVYGVYEVFIDKVDRADGFFSHSLTFGNVMAMVAIAVFCVLVLRLYKDRQEMLLFLAVLACTSIALMASGSRGPILAFITVAFLVLVYRFRLKGFVAGVIMITLLTAVIIETPSLHKRFMKGITNYNKTTSSVGTRIVLWEASSKAIMLRPFFGYGKRNFKSEVSKFIDVPTSSRAHAHNSYIQYTFLHGFFGLFALMGFLGSLAWEIIRRMKSSPIIQIAIFVLIVFMLEGLTENNFGDSEVAMMCYSIIGLLLAPGRATINIGETNSQTI